MTVARSHHLGRRETKFMSGALTLGSDARCTSESTVPEAGRLGIIQWFNCMLDSWWMI